MKIDTGFRTRMYKKTFACVFALTATLVMSLVQAQSWTGNANFIVGLKELKSTDWEPVDSHFASGAVVDFRKVDWPVSIAIDIIGSGDVKRDGSDKDKGYTTEQHIGVRKIWDDTDSSFRPYVGGGIAVVWGKIERRIAGISVDDDDTGTGFWLGTGTYWTAGPKLNLGFDIRYSKADITLFDKEREAGGLTAGLFVGYHW